MRNNKYRLPVSWVQAEDQGTYRCNVSEWIKEQGNRKEFKKKPWT